MSTEYPILLTGDMVRAVIDGNKTVTRRVIFPQPKEYRGQIVSISDSKQYWKKGDLIWVRETWSVGIEWNDTKPSEIDLLGVGDIDGIWYWADGEPCEGWGKKRPSIFMPKLFARLFLEIRDIRAERLQEINKEDAIREGIEISTDHGEPAYYLYNERLHYTPSPIESFQTLWDSINFKHGYRWKSNPWVWRIEFITAHI